MDEMNCLSGVKLIKTDGGLALTDGKIEIKCDFSALSRRLKPNNLGGELVVRAAKIKNSAEGLTVIDATAGMGEDSFLLAAAGFRVILFERDGVISSLLSDGLERAKADHGISEIASRMELRAEDSIAALPSLVGVADVIFLDPMFPERTKSAEVKKKFQLIHGLEKPCADEEELFDAALSALPQKIIVKRPLKAPYLAGRKPGYSISGKAIRYDCYVLPKK